MATDRDRSKGIERLSSDASLIGQGTPRVPPQPYGIGRIIQEAIRGLIRGKDNEMGIDFNKIFHDMLSAGKGELRQDGKEAQAYFHQVMNDSKDELTMLANDRLEGKLTDAGLQEELRTIKRDTVVDLKRGESVITEEAAERACSAALAVLRKSIQKAL